MSENVIYAECIAQYLNKKLIGKNIAIKKAVSLSRIKDNSIVFVRSMNEEVLLSMRNSKDVLFIVPTGESIDVACSYIESDNPRYDFIKILSKYFYNNCEKRIIHPTAIIEEGAKIGKNVAIGAHCFISKNAVIRDNCVLYNNVVVNGDVEMGENCLIKSGAVIGEEGFGFERDEQGVPIYFPHQGDVRIGNNVFIGSNSSVEKAPLDSTIIEDNVKIDDLVQIGHSSRIGENSIITAGVIICGSASIGKNCWLSPNVTVKQKVVIGDNATIGMGAVVIRNVQQGLTVAGVPAKTIEKKEFD